MKSKELEELEKEQAKLWEKAQDNIHPELLIEEGLNKKECERYFEIQKKIVKIISTKDKVI